MICGGRGILGLSANTIAFKNLQILRRNQYANLSSQVQDPLMPQSKHVKLVRASANRPAPSVG
jgi:hypothetical protein